MTYTEAEIRRIADAMSEIKTGVRKCFVDSQGSPSRLTLIDRNFGVQLGLSRVEQAGKHYSLTTRYNLVVPPKHADQVMFPTFSFVDKALIYPPTIQQRAGLALRTVFPRCSNMVAIEATTDQLLTVLGTWPRS